MLLNYGLKIAMKNADYYRIFRWRFRYLHLAKLKSLITPILNNEADVIIAKFPPAKKKGGFRICKETSKRICIRNDG